MPFQIRKKTSKKDIIEYRIFNDTWFLLKTTEITTRSFNMSGICQKQNIITVILIVATLVYITFGALIFQYLEDSSHKREIRRSQEVYRNITHKYNISEEDIDQLVRILHKNKWPLNKHALEPWEFPGAFYFTTVTVTTIGESVFRRYFTIWPHKLGINRPQIFALILFLLLIEKFAQQDWKNSIEFWDLFSNFKGLSRK